MIEKERRSVSKNSNSLNAMIQLFSVNGKSNKHLIANISETIVITKLLDSTYRPSQVSDIFCEQIGATQFDFRWIQNNIWEQNKF